MGYRVALVNNKGGTGKTATTVNLAAALAERGRRVLVVDMDPQMNADRRFGVRFRESDPVPTVSEAIKAGTSGAVAGALAAIAWPEPYRDRIRLAPSRFDLENRISEAAVIGATSRLLRALDGVDAEDDVTLIDCPPSLGHLTQMGMVAADAVVCVVEPEYDAIEAAIRVRDFIAAYGPELKGPGLEIVGYIVNRVRKGLGAHAYQLDGLADVLGDRVWPPFISERAVIKDAADSALPLRVLGGTAAKEMAEVYDALADRLDHERKSKETSA